MDSQAIITTQLVTLATVILGFIVALYREQRNRKWDLEDRQRARNEMIARQEESDTASKKRHEQMPARIAEFLQKQIDAGHIVPTPEIKELLSKLDQTPQKVEEVRQKANELVEVAHDTNIKVSELKEVISNEAIKEEHKHESEIDEPRKQEGRTSGQSNHKKR